MKPFAQEDLDKILARENISALSKMYNKFEGHSESGFILVSARLTEKVINDKIKYSVAPYIKNIKACCDFILSTPLGPIHSTDGLIDTGQLDQLHFKLEMTPRLVFEKFKYGFDSEHISFIDMGVGEYKITAVCNKVNFEEVIVEYYNILTASGNILGTLH